MSDKADLPPDAELIGKSLRLQTQGPPGRLSPVLAGVEPLRMQLSLKAPLRPQLLHLGEAKLESSREATPNLRLT